MSEGGGQYLQDEKGLERDKDRGEEENGVLTPRDAACEPRAREPRGRLTGPDIGPSGYADFCLVSLAGVVGHGADV